jgi:hypothetical protein
MSIRKDFIRDIENSEGRRIEGQGLRPPLEVWPAEDDFGRWIAAHEDPVRAVICNTPELSDAPWCGPGIH